MSSDTPKLYFITITAETTANGVDQMKIFERILSNLQHHKNMSRVLYRFKITGEPRVVTVIESPTVVGLERTMAGLSRVGNVKVKCEPVLSMELLSRLYGHDERLLTTAPNKVFTGPDIYLLEITVDNYTKTTKEMLEICKENFNFILSTRMNGLPVVTFNVGAQRKIVMFMSDSLEHINTNIVHFPLMREAGGNTRVKCREIQDLVSYIETVVSSLKTLAYIF